MGLFKPAWQSDNMEKALKAVKGTTDYSKLITIAINAPLADVRMAAVVRFSELKWEVRILAEKQLISSTTDQSILTHIANKHCSGDLENSILAAEKLIDKALAQQVYTDIVKRYGYQSTQSHYRKYNIDSCIEAVRKITDQNLLVDIAKGNNGFKKINVAEIRCEALKFIADQTLLADIVKSQINMFVREKASEYIKDSTVLDELSDIISDIKRGNVANKVAYNKFINEENKQKNCTHVWVEQVGYDDNLGHVKYIRCKKCGKYKDGMTAYNPT